MRSSAGGGPVDRLAAGDFDAVRAAAESYTVGDYV